MISMAMGNVDVRKFLTGDSGFDPVCECLGCRNGDGSIDEDCVMR